MRLDKAIDRWPVTTARVPRGAGYLAIDDESLPAASRSAGTPLDRMTQIDLDSAPLTPYHNKISTTKARCWHEVLVTTADVASKRYDQIKSFGAKSDFYLEDLSGSLNKQVDVLKQKRTHKFALAAGAFGLGLASASAVAFLGQPALGMMVALAGTAAGSTVAIDAAFVKGEIETTRLAARFVEDWTKI